MTPERYQQVKSAFRCALEHLPSERPAFLRERYASDPSLLEDVLALLASDSAPATSLDRPVVGTEFRLRTKSLSFIATPH